MTERYYSKKDFFSNIIYPLTMIFILIFALVNYKSPAAFIISLCILLFLLSMYCFTYYEFRENYLFCRSGILTARIYYKDISVLTICKSYSSSMALSLDRIRIVCRNKNIFLRTTYISPCNLLFFYDRLKRLSQI